MDFFESQETARKNTGKLVLLFGLAVFSLVLITNILFVVSFGVVNLNSASVATGTVFRFDWQIFAISGTVIFGVVLLATLYRVASLSGGGARIAEMMNGRLLVSGGNDLYEQRVLNVVEEMAIASGTPVPPIYIMNEAGINAFAAGYAPSDAVIGITRGAIETLNRDQLQGVIAHEFSHILHGDMRINIRLIGVLFGIMVLGQIGYYLLRSSRYSRRSSKGSGGIVLFGLGLLVIGYIGVFFGNLIKAAVSRQREFLADASAVQYTRNPEGIAGALMKIATHASHSYLDNPKSEEISHALFEEGRVTMLSSLFATHPPLERRIAAILPRWDGSYDLMAASAQEPSDVREAVDSKAQAASRQERMHAVLTAAAGVLVADSLGQQVGNP
ncbi:MAG: M48 family metallopeptidase, partial [Gammaproteobacteria bacterium]